jgi:hypothetical protein
MRSDRMIASQMDAFAALSPEPKLDAISDHLKQDPSRVELAGLFGSNGRLIAGNLESLPPDLEIDSAVPSADRAKCAGRRRASDRTKCR